MNRLILGGILCLLLVTCSLGVFFLRSPFPVAIDVYFHVRFAQDFFQAFAEGEWWPSWDARPFGGRGSAAFQFYAPAVYFLSLPFQVAGISAAGAVKAVVLLFALIGAWGVHRWLTALGEGFVPWLGTAIFLLGPVLPIYLFQVFNFQNLCAFLFLPWVFAGWTRAEKDSAATVELAVAIGIMGWIHLPGTLIAGYSLVLPALWATWQSRSVGPLRRLFTSCLLGFCLFSPYALVAVLRAREVHFDYLNALVPWDRLDFFDDPLDPGNPVWAAIQKVFALAAVTSALAAIPGFVSLLFGGGLTGPVVAFSLTGGWFFFMTFRFSTFLWKVLPGVKVLQYPYRWVFPVFLLLLPLMTVAFGAGRKKSFGVLAGFFLLLMVSLGVVVQACSRDLTLNELHAIEAVGIRYPREYLPRSCRDFVTLESAIGPGRTIRVTQGAGSIENEIHRFATSRFDCRVEAPGAEFLVMTHFDRNWELRGEQGPVPLLATSSCGLISFSLPAGRYRLELRRSVPGERMLGWVLFFLAAGFCAHSQYRRL